MLSVRALKKLIESELSALGIEESECRAESEAIVWHFTGLSSSERQRQPELMLDEELVAQAKNVLLRRKKHEPLQYCLGESYFYGMRFKIRQGVLIPRSDTETLVEAALRHFSSGADGKNKKLRLAEIGVGSGIISISLLSHLSRAQVFGCDISADAIELSRENADLNGVGERLELFLSDWRDCLTGQNEKFDGILANPPYIAARDKATLAPELSWEPEAALFGGDEDGLGFYRDFARYAGAALKSDGRAFLEIGAAQSESISNIFLECKWTVAAVHLDLNRIARVLSVIPPNSPF